MGFGGFFLGRVGQDLGLGFQGERKGYQSSPRNYKWGGESGVEGGARRILDLVFSGNGREGYQLSPRDSKGGIIEN